MKRPKIYVEKYNKVFDVQEIHFDIDVVCFDNGQPDFAQFEFEDVEFIYGTGFIDKNGKEIESGDILKTDFAGIISIKFHNVYGFYIVKEDDIYWFAEEAEGEDKARETLSKTEVIGNIYENKELLEE